MNASSHEAATPGEGGVGVGARFVVTLGPASLPGGDCAGSTPILADRNDGATVQPSLLTSYYSNPTLQLTSTACILSRGTFYFAIGTPKETFPDALSRKFAKRECFLSLESYC